MNITFPFSISLFVFMTLSLQTVSAAVASAAFVQPASPVGLSHHQQQQHQPEEQLSSLPTLLAARRLGNDNDNSRKAPMANRNNYKTKSTSSGGATTSRGTGSNYANKKQQTFRKSTSVTTPRLLKTESDSAAAAQAQRRVDSIGCPHFETCSGCSVQTNVDTVEIIDRSAKLYFGSTAVRRKRVVEQTVNKNNNSKSNNRKNEVVNENDNNNSINYDKDDYPVLIPSDITKWRTQAKLAVAAPPEATSWTRRSSGCIFGLYARNSHTVMSIPDCSVHHPSINEAVQLLTQATKTAGTVPYAHASSTQPPTITTKKTRQQPSKHAASLAVENQGTLRYVQLQVERSTGKVCLTLVWNAAHIKDTQPALSRLVKELQALGSKDGNSGSSRIWHSIWCHCNDNPGNAIFARNPKRWYRLWGPEFVREPIPVVAADQENDADYTAAAGWLYFTPFTFRQGNMDGFDVLARDVAQMIPSGSKVCELYAGVGVLGLTALAYHHNEVGGGGDSDSDDALIWLRCSDENPFNPRCFEKSVESLPASVTGRSNLRKKYDKRRDYNNNNYDNNDDDDEEGLTFAELAALMKSGQSPPPAPKQKSNNNNNKEKTSYMVASATQALRVGEALGANVLIVDPPRKGLDDGVLEELCKPFKEDQPYTESAELLTIPDYQVHWANDVQTLIYVSCGFDALARDTERLLSSPAGWRLKRSKGYVLFPGSDHVETVCVFERA